MTSRKEKKLAQKKAKIEALEKKLQEKGKNRSLLSKIVWGAVFMFIGLPVLFAIAIELSLSPEDREARALKAAAEEIERHKVLSEEKIKKTIQNLETSIQNSNHSSIVKYYDALKTQAPEKAKSFESDVQKSKSVVAEQERIRKLNFTGNFYIGTYVDEFGDKTGEKFVGYKGSGKFSNSATENSSLNFWVAMNSSSEFDIALYEYGGKNPVKDVFGRDSYIIRYRYSDVTGQVTCDNRGDRISCGNVNSQKLHQALTEASKVKFSIYNDKYRTSQYFFTMNANGYKNAMRKLGK